MTVKEKKKHDLIPLPHGVQPASVGTRIATFLIDSLALSLVNAAAGLATYFLFYTSFDQLSESGLVGTGWEVVYLIGIITTLVNIVYFLLSWWLWNGLTIGKRALGLRVVQMETLEPPSLSKSILRTMGYLTWNYFFPLVFVPLFTEHKRGIQDYLAGTVVVQDNTLPDWAKQEHKPKRTSA